MKTAIITGTSSGIGEAFARALLDLGWKVYGISRRENHELLSHANFRQIYMDLRNPIVEKTLEKLIPEKHIELLINNAGIVTVNPANTWDKEKFDESFSVNYISPAQLACIFTDRLHGGMILSILTPGVVGVLNGWNNYAYYVASKAALWLHMKAFSDGNRDIKCISLHPIAVQTPMTDAITDWTEDERLQFLKTKDLTTVLLQLVSKILDVPSGSSIYIYNESRKEELADYREATYFYNMDTEQLKKV